MSVLYRLWRIVRRERHRPGCPRCGVLLQACPTCKGLFWQTGCRRCAVGAICPTHERHWPA